MFDKLAAALSVIALGAASFAVFKTTITGNSRSPVTEQAIARYLQDNPQSIVASLESYEREAREAAARQQSELDINLVAANEGELLEDGYSHVSGNPQGDVTVVEFLDYNCGYCKRAHGEVQSLLAGDENIRYVVKEFPILGPGSKFAAQAILASRQQGGAPKYDEFSDRLMSYKGTHSNASVLEIATDIGFDIEQLQVDMASPEIDQMLEKTYTLANTLGITGTPAFVVGDSIVRGYVPAARLSELAEAARSATSFQASGG